MQMLMMEKLRIQSFQFVKKANAIFKKKFFLGRRHAQRGPWTQIPEMKSRTPYWLSHPGTPAVFLLYKNGFFQSFGEYWVNESFMLAQQWR